MGKIRFCRQGQSGFWSSITVFAVLNSFFLFSCQSESQTNQESTILDPIAEGKSFNAGFLIVDGVFNSELVAPYDIFQHTVFHTNGGIEVFTVGLTLDTVTTFEGIRILPDYSIKNAPEIDILVVPSAENSMTTDLDNLPLISFVRETGSKASFAMSLCDGAFVLAKAGLASGKISTTFPSDISRYRETFPSLDVIENVSFVHDGNLLTSAGGAKSYDVALYLAHLLYGEQVAKNVGKGLVIDWDLADYKFVSKP